MPDVLRQKPRESDGVDSVIVVDGVPVVGADRVDKLKNVIRKTFGKFGKLVNEHYPLDDEGQTKGKVGGKYVVIPPTHTHSTKSHFSSGQSSENHYSTH